MIIISIVQSIVALYLAYYATTTGAANARFLYILSFGMILLIQYLLLKGKTVLALWVTTAVVLLHYRVYVGPLFDECSPSFSYNQTTIVLITTVNSSRHHIVQDWVSSLLPPYPLVVDTGQRPITHFMPPRPEIFGTKIWNYTERVYDLFYRYYSTEEGWLLLLEDDAVPVSPRNLERTLRCVISLNQDVTYLDYRSFGAAFLKGSYFGTVGLLLKRQSLQRLAELFPPGFSQTDRVIGHDTIIGRAIDSGQVTGSVVPCLTERKDLPSTLDWGRESTDRDLPVTEILLVQLLSIYLIYRHKKRYQQ